MDISNNNILNEDIEKYINNLDSFFSNDRPMGDEFDQIMSEKKFEKLNEFIRENTETEVEG